MRPPSIGIDTRFGPLTPPLIQASINAAARMEVFDPENMPTCAYGSMYYLESKPLEAAKRAIDTGSAKQAIWRFHTYMLEELDIDPVEGALLPDPLETAFAVFRVELQADCAQPIVGVDLANLFSALAHGIRRVNISVLTEISIRPQLMTLSGRRAEYLENMTRMQNLADANPPSIAGQMSPASAASNHGRSA